MIFRLILTLRSKIERGCHRVSLSKSTTVFIQQSNETVNGLIKDDLEQQKHEAEINEHISIDNIKNILSLLSVPIFNLSLVETSD